MLDVLLIREFGVEEINAQSVAKAFIDGARMVRVLDESNIIADIDQLAAKQPPRRELASPPPSGNIFRQSPTDDADEGGTNNENTPDIDASVTGATDATDNLLLTPEPGPSKAPATTRLPLPASRPAPAATTDAIAHLFGLNSGTTQTNASPAPPVVPIPPQPRLRDSEPSATATQAKNTLSDAPVVTGDLLFRIQLTGPGINTQLEVVDVDDLTLVRALLNKIERRLKQ